MRTRYRAPLLAAILPLVLFSVGCNLVKAKAAFKDGNARYKEENYRKAIEDYERSVALKPDFAEAQFYLASSHQNLFRPGKEGAENRAHLDTAIEHYEKSLEVNPANTAERKQLRLNTLGALTSIYSNPPLLNYEKALGFAEQIVKDDPNDIKNLYAMASLYEKFNRIGEAEDTYKKVVELNPSDVKACGSLAAFYNKANWDEQGGVYVEGQTKSGRRSKFDLAIATLEKCAQMAPADPSGYQKVATFYWDKAYRDPNLTDEQKNMFADKGIEAVNKALEINPGSWEAIIYKGLLYREKAKVAPPAERKKYLEDAQLFQKQAMDLRKEQQAATSGAAGTEGVPPEAAAAEEK
jgi:tetratricopeptide (TPR) repeat protein